MSTATALDTKVVEGRVRTSVSVRGPLDAHTVADLRLALLDAVARKPREIVVSLSDSGDVRDPAAVEPIVGAARMLRVRDGRLWMDVPSRAVVDALHRLRCGCVSRPGTRLVEVVP